MKPIILQFSLLNLLSVLFFIKLTCFSLTSSEPGLSRKKESLFGLPSVCQSKCQKNMKDTETKVYCDKHGDLQVRGRCCINDTSDNTVVKGIDLQDCKMSEELFSKLIGNLSELAVISLEGNPIDAVISDDFNTNTDIEYLSLPPNVSCPGHSDVWKSQTTDKSHVVCYGELDPCTVHNVTCPDNSHCVHSGIDLTECLCDEGFHGYKCLDQGEFPIYKFAIGLAVPTVCLCIFLWVTQRRYVKKRD